MTAKAVRDEVKWMEEFDKLHRQAFPVRKVPLADDERYGTWTHRGSDGHLYNENTGMVSLDWTEADQERQYRLEGFMLAKKGTCNRGLSD